ncbi:extracellular catalytic domain type 1 short-chain-length polyhydroxyalkanoate depolymerase [Schauerella aestuarii]|uniref:extracellular catalytic domain type 1 short-chain-length polyhydroxyalkanoate depolymerase n=1 Tax=Schauerella aestuarii TaxID=2511204 RepID=UPI00136B5CC4|nr:PHB depolymerase family esterase [Achromobacter aestuarii]MYZ43590.1 PHB depolymerase family esterase [Achromobacter aestuarii]
MPSDFQYLMDEATRHTRAGNLHAATAAIQRAMMPAPIAPPKARTTAARAAEPRAAYAHTTDAYPTDASGAASNRPQMFAAADIIDVDARDVDEPTRPIHTAQATNAAPAAPVVLDTPAPQTRAPESATFEAQRYSGAAGQMDYKLFIPARTTQAPMPLLVMLHGCTQNPDDFAAGTTMNRLAQEQGFAVLYPAQSQQANPQRCWNWFKHNHQARDRGEPAMIAGATREVMATLPIDPKRVFVAGLSAGGAMAAIMGRAYPDLYAAVGVHSGLAAGAATDLPSAMMAMNGVGGGGEATSTCAVRTIVFHGDADSTVHPINGERAFAACADPKAANQVEEIGAAQAGGRGATRTVKRAGDGTVIAEYWVVHGARHAWSGGDAAGSYTDAAGPDASREMLRFFMNASSGASR